MDVICTLNQRIDDEVTANVLCFNNLTESPTVLQEFTDAMRTSLDTHIQGTMSSVWHFDSITFSFISGSAVTYSVNYVPTSGVLSGSAVGNVMPSQVCLLVSTAYVGAAPNRGRIYFGGLTESSNGSGVWDAGSRSAFGDLVREWRDGLTTSAGNHFLRILRRPSSVFPAYVSNPVNAVSPRVYPAIQRKRRSGTT